MPPAGLPWARLPCRAVAAYQQSVNDTYVRSGRLGFDPKPNWSEKAIKKGNCGEGCNSAARSEDWPDPFEAARRRCAWRQVHAVRRWQARALGLPRAEARQHALPVLHWTVGAAALPTLETTIQGWQDGQRAAQGSCAVQ